jgi:hypothetical protein
MLGTQAKLEQEREDNGALPVTRQNARQGKSRGHAIGYTGPPPEREPVLLPTLMAWSAAISANQLRAARAVQDLVVALHLAAAMLSYDGERSTQAH